MLIYMYQGDTTLSLLNVYACHLLGHSPGVCYTGENVSGSEDSKNDISGY